MSTNPKQVARDKTAGNGCESDGKFAKGNSGGRPNGTDVRALVQRESDGKFAKGTSGGPGRPRGTDFRALVQQHRAETYDETLLNVYDALAMAAMGGDVPAAKLLLDRLCENDPKKLMVTRSLEAIIAGSWDDGDGEE